MYQNLNGMLCNILLFHILFDNCYKCKQILLINNSTIMNKKSD